MKLVSLSEQQLLDCSPGNKGCDAGGSRLEAFKYIKANQGITTEDKYPYQKAQQTCKSIDYAAATISGYEQVPEDDEQALLQAVSQQPVSVGIVGIGKTFMHYQSGIFDDENGGTDSRHAVTIIGYGTSEEGKYWLLKNSWGESWGEQGYMRIKRDVASPQGMYGLASRAYYPVA